MRLGLAGRALSLLHVELRDPGVDMTAGARPTVPRHRQPLTRLVADAVANGRGVDVEGMILAGEAVRPLCASGVASVAPQAPVPLDARAVRAALVGHTVESQGGRLTFVSPQLHELIGYSPELPLGDRDWWWAHVHPEDRDEVQLANRKERGKDREPQRRKGR